METQRALAIASAVIEPLLVLLILVLLVGALAAPFLPKTWQLELPLRPDPAAGDARLSHDATIDRIETAMPGVSARIVLKDGESQLIVERLAGEEAADQLVAEVIAAGYRPGDRDLREVPDLERLVERGPSALPLLLAVEKTLFLLLGLALIRIRVAPEPAAPRGSTVAALAWGVSGAIAALTLSALIGLAVEALGLPVDEQDWVRQLLDRPAALLRVLPLLVVLGPVAEEVFFRGYVHRAIRQRAGIPAGLLVSATLFAVVHYNPSGFPVYLVIGSVFSLVYERTGRLLAPIAGHVVFNALVVGLGVYGA